MDVRDTQRTEWHSRRAFVVTCISSGASVATFLRFPALAFQFNGKGFLLFFIISVIFIAVPCLTLELAMGQLSKTGAVGAMQKVLDRRFKGLAWYSIFIGFVQAATFTVWTAWVVLFLRDSFGSDIPYGDPGGTEAIIDVARSGSATGPLIAAVGAQWVFVAIVLSRGVRSLGRVVSVTLGFVTVVLAGLMIRAVLLPGGVNGVKLFFNFSMEFDSAAMLAAFGQSLMTLSLGVGVMQAFGSHNRKSRDIVKYSIIIGAVNFGYAMMWGVLSFALLGSISVYNKSPTFTAEFMYHVLPHIVKDMPRIVSNFTAFMMCMAVLLLGTHSALSCSFAVQTTIIDALPRAFKPVVSLIICVAGFLLSLPLLLIRNSSYDLLRCITHYSQFLCVPLVTVLLCVSAGYFADKSTLRQRIHELSRKGFGKCIDVTFVGCFYSIIELQREINKIGKVSVHRPIWCVLIKYVVTIIGGCLTVSQLLRIAARPDEVTGEVRPLPTAISCVGWGLVGLLVPSIALSWVLYRKKQTPVPLWTADIDGDLPSPSEHIELEYHSEESDKGEQE